MKHSAVQFYAISMTQLKNLQHRKATHRKPLHTLSLYAGIKRDSLCTRESFCLFTIRQLPLPGGIFYNLRFIDTKELLCSLKIKAFSIEKAFSLFSFEKRR